MIEKKIMKNKIKEFLIDCHISKNLPKACYSGIELQKTPLGDKIIIHTSRPGMVVGRKGENLSRLTEQFKKQFKMENPQIEIAEIKNPFLDARSVAERIASSFERFGPKRFKSTGYRSLQSIIDAGAIGAEITIAGRGVPSSRARLWRFTAGHMKKSGDISENKIKRAKVIAHLKSGAVGIQVSILTPDIELPDEIKFKYETEKKNITFEEEPTRDSSPNVAGVPAEAKEEKPKSPEVKKKEPKKKESQGVKPLSVAGGSGKTEKKESPINKKVEHGKKE